VLQGRAQKTPLTLKRVKRVIYLVEDGCSLRLEKTKGENERPASVRRTKKGRGGIAEIGIGIDQHLPSGGKTKSFSKG